MPPDPRRRRALQLRARGADWPDIANQLGVTERTLRRWRDRPGFAAELERARQDTLDDQMARLMAILPIAVDKLGEALESKADTPRMKAIELLAKWTGLAAAITDRPEPTEGGIPLDELDRRLRGSLAALGEEDEILDGG